MSNSCQKNAFAIICPWPNIPNAENECAQRILISGNLIGKKVFLVDILGREINSKRHISCDEVDFFIHQHFLFPKCYNGFSYSIVWNPSEFYFDWGFEKCTRNMLTHDSFLSCGSNEANNHIKTFLQPNSNLDFIPFYNSLSEPFFIAEKRINRKAFYCGINWERDKKNPGRYASLLKYLDKKNLVNLFGPKKIGQKKPWAGYKNYQGEIPFDGKSLIHKIHEAGICLVFSSDPHKRSGLMSNRLMEAIAAGAAIICDDHPFAKKYFSDNLFYINFDQPQENLFQELELLINYINLNPDLVFDKIIRCQKIFKEKFVQTKLLENLYENHLSNLENYYKNHLHISLNLKAQIIIPCLTDNFDLINKTLNSLQQQIYNNIEVFLIGGTILNNIQINSFKFNLRKINFDFTISDNKKNRNLSIYDAFLFLKEEIDKNSIVILSFPGEELDSFSISRLVRCFEQKTLEAVEVSGIDYCSKNLTAHVRKLGLVQSTKHLHSHELNVSRFIFRGDFLKTILSDTSYTPLDLYVTLYFYMHAHVRESVDLILSRRELNKNDNPAPYFLKQKKELEYLLFFIQKFKNNLNTENIPILNDAYFDILKEINQISTKQRYFVFTLLLSSIKIRGLIRKVFKKIIMFFEPAE